MTDTTPNFPEIPPLVTMGEPRLAQPSAPVDPTQIAGEAFQQRLETLAQAMVAYQGIGIAAPQIGWYERFFLMVLEDVDEEGRPTRQLQAWINPEIVSASDTHNWAWEGCLSVPGLRGWIRRPDAVAVRGFDHTGQPVALEYRGWEARVFQHEFDHLEGMLFPYRALDARHLVMTEHLETREDWPENWPAPGARDAPMGDVVPDPPGFADSNPCAD